MRFLISWCYFITYLPMVYLEPTLCLALQSGENNDEQTQHWSCQNPGKSTWLTHDVTLLRQLVKCLIQTTSQTMVIITNLTYWKKKSCETLYALQNYNILRVVLASDSHLYNHSYTLRIISRNLHCLFGNQIKNIKFSLFQPQVWSVWSTIPSRTVIQNQNTCPLVHGVT